MKPKPRCTTHHHACECRELALLNTIKPTASSLRDAGLNGNEVAMQSYIDINEIWIELYGCEILDDNGVRP